MVIIVLISNSLITNEVGTLLGLRIFSFMMSLFKPFAPVSSELSVFSSVLLGVLHIF